MNKLCITVLVIAAIVTIVTPYNYPYETETDCDEACEEKVCFSVTEYVFIRSIIC